MTKKHYKFLIIRLSSIGDILLTTPFIRQIKIAYPDSEIHFLIKKEFLDLIKCNPYLDKIIYYDSETGKTGLRDIALELKGYHYSHVFDLHNNFRSKYVCHKLSGSRMYSIHKDKIKRALLVFFKINRYDKIVTIPERYLNVGSALNIKDDFEGLEIFWDSQTDQNIDNLIKEHSISSKIIIIGPGAGHFTKRWPIEYFKELVHGLTENNSFTTIVLGSLDEHEEFNCLLINNNVFNFAGRLSLLESAALIKRSKCVVSNDSGLMHLATAVKVPVIAIFGSTVKELGFFPYRSENYVFENLELKCRPCSHLGKNKCPKGHFKCMLSIKPESVYKKVMQFAG
ncbi:MAG: glycosyltransferase family 9 protein [Calditrichaeota bacterium]|nr:MAG: glycosyltransferase family 9 protein [Calditrichota bacterium]